MKSKRPTQADVARQAGVTRGTVSLVLNHTEGRIPISQETRERVLATAKALGYSPNPVAQMLARGSNRIIGIFSFEETFPYTPADFYYPYLIGIEREAAVQDYNILLFTHSQAETVGNFFQSRLNSLRLADGVILTGNYPDSAALRWLLKENYPFVLIGRSTIPQNEIDTIVNDHKPASYEAARHLLELGHRQLGLVVDDVNLAYHQERLEGCQMALAETSEAHLTILNKEVLASPAEFITTIRQNKITALICADRKLVSPTINLLQEIPLEIPKELSLVFLVSNTWDLPFANPTRVSLNRDVIGRMAVQRLVERLQGSLSGYRQTQVPCRFVIGTTTAPVTIS